MTGKYNFVVMEHSNPHYSYNYAALKGRSDARFCNGVKEHIPLIFRVFHRVHTSLKLNSVITLPFKSIWFPLYSKGFALPVKGSSFKPMFERDGPVCFIVDADFFRMQQGFDGYINWLRTKFAASKFVLFYQDLIEKYGGDSSIERLCPLFDMVLSFDRDDASRHNVMYHPTVSSYIDTGDCSGIPQSDVYLLAHAKERLPQIVKIYDFLEGKGFSCRFLVLGVKKKEQICRSGIEYLRKPVSYFENLQNISRSGCILEIMQKNAVGYTLRLWEAVLYNKKFLTNNQIMVQSNFYDKGYVSVFNGNELDSIDVDFLRKTDAFENPFKSMVTPDNLLKFVEESL